MRETRLRGEKGVRGEVRMLWWEKCLGKMVRRERRGAGKRCVCWRWGAREGRLVIWLRLGGDVGVGGKVAHVN